MHTVTHCTLPHPHTIICTLPTPTPSAITHSRPHTPSLSHTTQCQLHTAHTLTLPPHHSRPHTTHALTPLTPSQEFDSLRRCVLSSLGQLQEEHQRLVTRVHSCLAGALVSLSSLPTKLNPVIRPLMDSVKTEKDRLMQVCVCVCVRVCACVHPCMSNNIHRVHVYRVRS